MSIRIFSKNIKFLRKLNKLTQIELAKYIDIDPTYISRIELNMHGDISVRLAKKFADFFKLSLDKIYKADLTRSKKKHTFLIKGISF